ncbi:hypothetical protein CRE_17382 [Caenorhabditis remanei]|uniref:DUF38 domain-containing protein n=1 Tax=Caenorhabditis remanei TaxID=31234 RepID=E3N220_CAERE|nr:hypothetical protein CRE_17382 [Caenorhabditis remanei]
MPLPLSYPSLKCVLEHLEAVKRAHIIARSPCLQKIDKLIPLCLGNLTINTDCFKNGLTINKLSIKCEKIVVQFKMNGKTFSRQMSVSLEVKMKKLINSYLCGKSKILVDKFQLSSKFHVHSLLPNLLPVNLKFRVNSLDAVSHEDFETVIPYIDHRSFPLKYVDTTIANTKTFDDQVVKSAETLVLNMCHNRIVTIENLKKLNNKTVVLQSLWKFRVDIVPLIKYHIKTKKDIRTTFVNSTDDKDLIDSMLHKFELEFGEFQCNLDGVNKRFIPGSSKFSIPINNESRIQVYAIEEPEEAFLYKIIVKPVP